MLRVRLHRTGIMLELNSLSLGTSSVLGDQKCRKRCKMEINLLLLGFGSKLQAISSSGLWAIFLVVLGLNDSVFRGVICR